MSAALEVPFVAEREGWRLALFEGHAILWVNEQVCDVAEAIEACFAPTMRPLWTVQAVESEGIWEVYRLDRAGLPKLV